MFFDAGMDDFERILTFSTNENIEHSKHNTVICYDETFKTAPASFEQIFTFQCKFVINLSFWYIVL